MPSAKSVRRTPSQRTIHAASVRNAHLAARHLQVPPPAAAAFATLACCTPPRAAGPSFTMLALSREKPFSLAIWSHAICNRPFFYFKEAFDMLLML